jgi:hypothetical protein
MTSSVRSTRRRARSRPAGRAAKQHPHRMSRLVDRAAQPPQMCSPFSSPVTPQNMQLLGGVAWRRGETCDSWSDNGSQ